MNSASTTDIGLSASERKNLFNEPVITAVMQAVLSAVLMMLVCNWHTIYEEDQLAKTAMVMSLDANSNWQHYATATDYYARDIFSAYYLSALAFYKLTHLPTLEALNVFSMCCGVVFFTIVPWFLRRAFQLSQWLAWLVLVSAPIFVITFNYGNEAAYAIALTAVAAFALTFNHPVPRILAAVFYVGAAYTRSDYLFLGPALAFVTLVRKEGRVDWRQSFKNAMPFTIAAAILGLAYLGLVVRHWPKTIPYATSFSFALTAAFFTYSPNVVSAVFAWIGLGVCLMRRRFQYLPLFLVFVQYLPYMNQLYSPKYIAPSVAAITVFAMVGMTPVWRRAPVAVGLLLALPWVMAVSPYGVFGPSRSVYWYVPTDDGPLPTGGFLPFYAKVKHGFYQRRYNQEMEQFDAAMPLIKDGRDGGFIEGWFNVGTERLWAARHGRWEIHPVNIPFLSSNLEEGGGKLPILLMKTGYLYGMKQPPRLQAQLTAGYDRGQVKAVSGDGTDPFPDVIQCGELVPKDSDRELGKRIEFQNSYYQMNHALRGDSFMKDFSGVSWILRERFAKEWPASTKPLYEDGKWVCLAEDVPNAVYYSMRFPMAYAHARHE